eukprot:symbB.v1.2.021764.t1/scaffold1821.1/size219240/3
MGLLPRGFSLQRWHPDDSVEDPHATQVQSDAIEDWALRILEPVLQALPSLTTFDLRVRGKAEPDELWLVALEKTSVLRKELRVHREPPVVEVYNIMEHGRHFYRFSVELGGSRGR